MFFSRDFIFFFLTFTLVLLFFTSGNLLSSPVQQDLTYAQMKEKGEFTPAREIYEGLDLWSRYFPRKLSSSPFQDLIATRRGTSFLSRIEKKELSPEETIDYWIDRLSFLNSPLKGAQISPRDSQLPNAPRHYRNGAHQGLDYYGEYCGIEVPIGTPVIAAGKGEIIRIDHDYQELSRKEREELLALAARDENTPEEALDKLRGRQVWIQHQDNIITRYAHLSNTCSLLQVGDRVQARQFIGEVGNSGTSHGVKKSPYGAHLHFEIWIDDYFFGQDMNLTEIRAVLEEVLPEDEILEE